MNPTTPCTIVSALSLVGPPDATAPTVFGTPNCMITHCDAIAIVEITRIEYAETKAKPCNYRQIAHATVHQTLKGELPGQVKLFGCEDRRSALTHYKLGRFLVFLDCKGGLLTGSNCHRGVRPIKETHVQWFVEGDDHAPSWLPLPVAQKRIAQALGTELAA